MKYTAIIIDDIVEARALLRSDIDEYCPEIQVIGEASSVVTGAKLLRSHSPDLIFLDIMLGDGTGFDLLEIIPNLNAKLIFITASDEFAIKAFRYSAIDYLLKPLDAEQLQEAVQKAVQKVASKDSIDLLKETIRNPDQLPSRISLPSQDRITLVQIDQIIRCESEGNNTLFILHDGSKIFVTKTLKSYEQILSHHHFIRVHQSHLVNLNYIKEYIKKEGGYIRMKNGDQVPVAVRKKAEVVRLLQSW